MKPGTFSKASCGSSWVQVKSKPAQVRPYSSPAGRSHTYCNPGPGPVRYLLVMTSNIYRLIQEIHKMPDRNPAALRARFKKYDSQLVE